MVLAVATNEDGHRPHRDAAAPAVGATIRPANNPTIRHARRAAGKAGKHTVLQQRAAGRSRCQACALSWDGRTLAGDVWLKCLEAPPPTAIGTHEQQ
jgi:hypothetical protein